MSDRKHSDILFTNEETVRRRAWIDRALAGVRGAVVPSEEAGKAREKSRKLHLYIASSNRTR